MNLVLSKIKKDAFTVFTSFQNKYVKAISRKSFHKIWQCTAYKYSEDQLSSRKYEELLGIYL